ncbi:MULTISPECIES: hypothetical protein [unclassified Vibrio]|uniref:hypothetical protein n=1 Tax=unclassified Vibrio TaxID=2614977 RepID=UPI00159E0834|nr:MULTISPECIES: hypothetical protein [unclassified Vibrio]NVN83215.1 hypothetical protein [Vibrio sp. Scap16]QLE91632.1 hypothetical protein FLM53_00435 [Vibrio sp. Scap24]
MKYLVFLLCFLSPTAALSDDSLINPVAKKIKTTIIKGLNKSHVDMNGYCDLMIEMKHSKGSTRIKNVRTSGDSKVCKQAKKHLPRNKKFKYSFPEKYIRIQVTG